VNSPGQDVVTTPSEKMENKRSKLPRSSSILTVAREKPEQPPIFGEKTLSF